MPLVEKEIMLKNAITNLVVISIIVCVVACEDSASSNQDKQFTPAGTWSYPQSLEMDSTLSKFTIDISEPDSALFRGYLNGSLHDSTNGKWIYRNDTLHLKLSACVLYGFMSSDVTVDGVGKDTCVSEIVLSRDGEALLDNTGKKYTR